MSRFQRLFPLFLGIGMLVAACAQSPPSTATVSPPTEAASQETAASPLPSPASSPTPTPVPTPAFLPNLHFPLLPSDLDTPNYEAQLLFSLGVGDSPSEDTICPAWRVEWAVSHRPQDVFSEDTFLPSQEAPSEDYFILVGKRSTFSVRSPYDIPVSFDENFQMFGAEGQVEVWNDKWFPYWQQMDIPTARQAFERYWLMHLTQLLERAVWLPEGEQRYSLRWPSLTEDMMLPWMQDCQKQEVYAGEARTLQGEGEAVVAEDGTLLSLDLHFWGDFVTLSGDRFPLQAQVYFIARVAEERWTEAVRLSFLTTEKGGIYPQVPLPPSTEAGRLVGSPRGGGWWGFGTIERIGEVYRFFLNEWPRHGFTLQSQESTDEGYRLFFQDEQGHVWEVILKALPTTMIDRTDIILATTSGAWEMPETAWVPAASSQGMAGIYCQSLGGVSTADGCSWPEGESCSWADLLGGSCAAVEASPWVWQEPVAPYCAMYSGRVERGAAPQEGTRCRFEEGAFCDAWAYFLEECSRGSQAVQSLPLDEAHFSAQVSAHLGPGETLRYQVSRPEYPHWPIMSDILGVPAEFIDLLVWLDASQDDFEFTVYDPNNLVVAHGTSNAGFVIYKEVYKNEDMGQKPFTLEVQSGVEGGNFTLHVAWASGFPDANAPCVLSGAQLDADGVAYFYQVSQAGRIEAVLEGDDTVLGLYLVSDAKHTYKVVLDPAEGRQRGTVEAPGPITVVIVVQGPPGAPFKLRSFSFLR